MSNEIVTIFQKNPDLLRQFRIGGFDLGLQIELDAYDEYKRLSPLMLTMGDYIVEKLVDGEDVVDLGKQSVLYSVGFYFSMFCILPFEFGIDDEKQLQALLTLAGAIVAKVLRIIQPKSAGIRGTSWPKVNDASADLLQTFDSALVTFWQAKDQLNSPSILNDHVPGSIMQDPPATGRFVKLAASSTQFVTQDRPAPIILKGLADVTSGTRVSTELLADNKAILATLADIYGVWSRGD